MTVTVSALAYDAGMVFLTLTGDLRIGCGGVRHLVQSKASFWLGCEDRTFEQRVKMPVVELKGDTIKSLDGAGSGAEVLSFGKLLLSRCVSGRNGRRS